MFFVDIIVNWGLEVSMVDVVDVFVVDDDLDVCEVLGLLLEVDGYCVWWVVDVKVVLVVIVE